MWKAGEWLSPEERRGSSLETSRKLPGPRLIIQCGQRSRYRVYTAMTEEERYCPFDLAFLMYEMEVNGFKAIDVDRGTKVGHLIELHFLFSPVKAFLPIGRQSFNVGQWSAISPLCALEFVRKSGERQLLSQTVDVCFWDRNSIRFYRCHYWE